MRRVLGSLLSSTALVRPLKRFARAQGGNVAVLFGLLTVPIFGLVGAAVDYTNASRMRGEIQEAIDAAALAGARNLHRSDADVRAAVEAFLNGNLPPHLHSLPRTITISPDRRTVGISMTGVQDTSVLKVIGIERIDVDTTAEATIGNETVEVAIALDVTGSMRRHVDALRTGARQLVDIIYSGETTSATVSASLVQYAATVNIGNGGRQMAWMDTNADARFHGLAFERVRIPDSRCWTPPPPPPPPVATGPRPPSPPPHPRGHRHLLRPRVRRRRATISRT
jgi:Flp pilus assembly protein TadG